MPKKLINWSKKNFSHLPWRENRTIYRTLVSEIMLQQTTVGTVLNHFERFLKKFPSIKSLSKASEEELLIEWKGLGYYRRAKNLKKIADQVDKKFNGTIPNNEDELLSLNGIGPYTANAILSIGLDKKAIAVDANLERVISRLYALEDLKGNALNKKIYQLFNQNKILNYKDISYRDLNEALMDLGRTYCKTMTVECQNCPMSTHCLAYKKREQLKFPVQKNQKKESYEIELVRFVVNKSNKILAYEKSEREWLHGQWELPTFILSTNDKKLNQYPYLSKKIDLKNAITFKTGITKYKITNYVVKLKHDEFKKITESKKYMFKEINRESNLSTASTKALAKIKL